MIKLPLQLTPSELLSYDGASSFVKGLLQQSRSLRREGRLQEAERRAQDAVEASQEPEARISRALAMVHLADLRREMGRLGPALAGVQQAHRIFQRQPAHSQRHNEAVAAYALGLTQQLLGSDVEAMKWYQESRELLKRVKDDWSAVNAKAKVETCTRLRQWTETLSEYLTSTLNRTDANISTRLWVPVVPPSDSGGEFAIAELEIGQYRLEREAMLKGESFQVLRLKGNQRVSILAGDEYCIQKITDDRVREFLGAEEHDYALIAWDDENLEDLGELETLSESGYGNFVRDADGTVYFVHTAPTVIGGVVALLRPTAPPSE